MLLDAGIIHSDGRIFVGAFCALPLAEPGKLRRHRILIIAGLEEEQGAADGHGGDQDCGYQHPPPGLADGAP